MKQLDRVSNTALLPVTVDRDISATMRDGVVLRADIFRPDVSGTFPTLVFRTPYDKRRSDDGVAEIYSPVARAAAARGYVVVMQDVRGRFASDGDFVPFFDPRHLDGADGYDTVEWAAALPYSNGRVGAFGDSYGAWTQWELAIQRPPHLVAIFPSGLPARAMDYPILRVGRRILWLIARMAPEERRRAGLGAKGPVDARVAYQLWDQVERGKWNWFLPWYELPDHVLASLGRWTRDLLDRYPVDYLGYAAKHAEVAVPALHLTGWFDISVGGSIAHYTGMVANARSADARRQQQLVIGPWTHMDPNYEMPRRLGDLDFRPEAEGDYVDMLVEWFDSWLKGAPDRDVNRAPIRLFVMGDNRWRDETEWPLRRTRYTPWYLHSDGHANTPCGTGTLDRTAPATDEPPDSYLYDPRDPVMSLYSRGAYYQPRDQAPHDSRSDVLVFVSAPLAAAMEVTGPINVELFAASSARDTDFTASLVDLHPDGKAIGLTCGIVRARYRAGTDQPSLLEAGRVYPFAIELEPTSFVFAAGHRIRLDISSSDFPNFDRNHNTGGNDFRNATLVTARQRVCHSPAYPSRVILPVIPRGELTA